MKKLTMALLAATIALYSAQAASRDDRLRFSIEEALSTEVAKQKLDAGIRFYFGDQKHGPIAQKFGQFASNKKTNAFNKSDQKACEWAFLSALISLQQRAVKEGGNAVINIISNYKNVEFKSDTEFECGAGALMAGSALKGTVVKLE